MFIISYGTLHDGFSFVGPFTTEQQAVDYVDMHDADESSPFFCVPATIQPLYKPEQ